MAQLMSITDIGIATAAVITAIVGAIAVVVKLSPERTKAVVESASTSVATALALQKWSTEEITQLRKQVERLKIEVEKLRIHQQERDVEMDKVREWNRALEDRVGLLERTLSNHEIPVPDSPHNNL